MVVNQKYFTVSERKEIFEILNGVNYKFRQLGSMHTNGMSLYFDDKSKKPIWHISIQTHNDGYRLIYSKFSDKENKWIRKDEQTCKYFDDVLSILKLYREKLDNLKNMNKITESILDRPFTVKWQDNPKLKKYNDAIVSVEGLKDMYIKVGKNFRIDLGKYEECGKRQINYLESHYYDISEKLMELSGMSNGQIQVCLEKLKAEKGNPCESFLSEFKPKYQNFNLEFCSFVRRHHLDFNDSDYFYTFAIEDLKESWEEFYTGGNSWADRLCLFYPAQYLSRMNKDDVVDHEKWEDFMFHSSGGRRLEDGYYYTLQTLDEAFEKFESSLGKVEESIENKLKEENMNKITYPFTLYSYVNEDKDERSEDLVYIYMEDDDDGWWESRCNLDDEKEFVIKSDEDYDEAMAALESLTSYDLGGKNIFPANFDEKLFSTGKAQYTFVDYEGKKSKCTMVAMPVQNLELTLAESFEKIFKDLQKEGLFESVKSFDLDFNGKGINIRLNEGYPGNRKDKPVVYTNDEVDIVNRPDYKYLEKVIDLLGGTKQFTHRKPGVEKPHSTQTYYTGSRSDDHERLSSDSIISYWTIPLIIKNIKLCMEVAVGYNYSLDRLSTIAGIYHDSKYLIEPSIRKILTSIGFEPAMIQEISEEFYTTTGQHYKSGYNSFTDTAPINAFVKSGSIAKVANILRDLKQKLNLVNKNWDYNFAKNEEEYYSKKGLIPGQDEYKVLVDPANDIVIASENNNLIKEDLHIFLNDLQEDNKNENIDWKHLHAWVNDHGYDDNVFESFIEEIKNEGFDAIKDILKIEVRDQSDAREKRLKSIEKNAKRDATHRYES